MSRSADAERHDPYVASVLTEVAVARVRAEVAALYAELVRYGLVVWNGGTVSARVPGADRFVIKASGAEHADVAPENLILCDLDGAVVGDTPGSDLVPPRDTASHAYVYRELPEVGGIVHTHSPYAVAWSARGEEIPCVLTFIADAFGGPVPVGPLVVGEDEGVGRGIVETLRGHRSSAVLMRAHGPFTIGPTAREAVRSAVLLEDAARAVHLARAGGDVEPLPDDTVDLLRDLKSHN